MAEKNSELIKKLLTEETVNAVTNYIIQNREKLNFYNMLFAEGLKNAGLPENIILDAIQSLLGTTEELVGYKPEVKPSLVAAWLLCFKIPSELNFAVVRKYVYSRLMLIAEMLEKNLFVETVVDNLITIRHVNGALYRITRCYVW